MSFTFIKIERVIKWVSEAFYSNFLSFVAYLSQKKQKLFLKSMNQHLKKGIGHQIIKVNHGGFSWDSEAAKAYLLTDSRFVVSEISGQLAVLITNIPQDWYKKDKYEKRIQNNNRVHSKR